MEDRLASIDLGSNIFRLSIARVVHSGDTAQIYTEDKLREMVGMASGLDEHQRIRAVAIEQALQVLRRFGERLQGFPPANVRAVATSTFRVARNAAEIMPAAERALGYPIEIISGHEEARLIYLGVIQGLPPSEQNRLVIDIGGGSTEFIIGQGDRPQQLASLPMGCTSWTRRYFPQGRISEARMRRAVLAARSLLQGISSRYQQAGWELAYGSSGTVKGLLAVLLENGFSRQHITLEGMQKLRAGLVKAGETRLGDWAGLKAERAPLLAGGLAIMIAAFQELAIDSMRAGEGALRLGVLHDLLGRDLQRDKRNETVSLMSGRYALDSGQAGLVHELALSFFDALQLGEEPDGQDMRQLLGWAAQLHEIGMAIARNDYHKHSAYILKNADMPGFSRDDQHLLAFLVLGQQGRLAKVRAYAPQRLHWLSLFCLRLAILLLRRRRTHTSLPLQLEARGQQIILGVNTRWLAERPLSSFMLKSEAAVWRKAGFTLQILET